MASYGISRLPKERLLKILALKNVESCVNKVRHTHLKQGFDSISKESDQKRENQMRSLVKGWSDKSDSKCNSDIRK